VCGLKWVSGFPSNVPKRLPTIVGTLVLNDCVTGELDVIRLMHTLSHACHTEGFPNQRGGSQYYAHGTLSGSLIPRLSALVKLGLGVCQEPAMPCSTSMARKRHLCKSNVRGSTAFACHSLVTPWYAAWLLLQTSTFGGAGSACACHVPGG
jgi:hypothetical protein